jgi:hypothetical protein
MNLKPILVLIFVISVTGCNSSKNSSPQISESVPTSNEELLAAERSACTEVDLAEKFGAIRNQGQTGFCYAFATADLLGAELQLPPLDMVSAYDLITNYISMDAEGVASTSEKLIQWGLDWVVQGSLDAKFNLPLVDRGSGATVILLAKAIADGKVCLEKDLPSQEMDYGKSYDDPLDEFINRTLLEDAGISKKDYITHHQASSKPSIDLSADDAINSLYRKNIVHFDSNKIEFAPPLYLPVVSNWEAMRARSKASSRCKNFIDISSLSAQMHYYTYRTNTTDLFTKDANVLLDKHQPFTISFDACSLLKNCKESIPHISVIIGRHWNDKTKQCQVKIRNSWGRQCMATPSDVHCNEGNYFIDLKKLARFARTIEFVNHRGQ